MEGGAAHGLEERVFRDGLRERGGNICNRASRNPAPAGSSSNAGPGTASGPRRPGGQAEEALRDLEVGRAEGLLEDFEGTRDEGLGLKVEPELVEDRADRIHHPGFGQRLFLEALADLAGPLVQDFAGRDRVAPGLAGVGDREQVDQELDDVGGLARLIPLRFPDIRTKRNRNKLVKDVSIKEAT